MTLEEAIEHCEEVAKQNRELARKITKDQCLYTDRFDEYACIKCAKEHEQLAEWLKELKQLKEQDLDKIKAEILQVADQEKLHDEKWSLGLRYAVKIINKYKAESEE